MTGRRIDRREALVTTAWAVLLAIPVLPLAIELARRADDPVKVVPFWVQGVASTLGGAWLLAAALRFAGARRERADRAALLVAASLGGMLVAGLVAGVALAALIKLWDPFVLLSIAAPFALLGGASRAAEATGRRVLPRNGDAIGVLFLILNLLAHALLLAPAGLVVGQLRLGEGPTTCLMLALSVAMQLGTAYAVAGDDFVSR